MILRSAFFITLGLLIAISAKAAPAPEHTEWVVVLEDPRPARLQGWQRSRYSSGGHYSRALELKRFGQRVADKHNLLIRNEWFIESLGVYCLIAKFNNNTEQATLDSLRADKYVKWVQPSNSFQLLRSTLSGPKENVLPNLPEMRLPESIDGKGVIVAVVDSAVDDTHSHIVARIIENVDFVRDENKSSSGEAHGTAMAGVIAADRKSHLGVTGVAPGIRLKAYRGCWETNNGSSVTGRNCSTLSLARALDAVATNGADILNLSLTGPKDDLLDQLVAQIMSEGTRVVTAFDPQRRDGERFPSATSGVLTVKAESYDTQELQVFSAPGSKVVAAPGNRADLMHGHSVATAYTSGVLALCMQIESQLGRTICAPSQFDGAHGNRVGGLNELVTRLENQLSN